MYQISNSPTGPFEGAWKTREAIDAYDDADENGNTIADYLDDDGTESDWYIRHPSGAVERVTYYGKHVKFVTAGTPAQPPRERQGERNMNAIELKHREGHSINCDGIPVEFLRTLKESGALAKGWGFEATIKADPFADDAHAVEAPAPKPRKARAPKAETAPAEKKPRAPKSDEAPPSHGEILDAIRAGSKSTNAIATAIGAAPRIVDGVLGEMDAAHKVRHNGKRGKGSAWEVIEGAQS